MKPMTAFTLISILVSLLIAAIPPAQAAVGVIAMCDEKGTCRLAPIASWTAATQSKVRLAPAQAAKEPGLLQKARTVKTESITKLYRNPATGELRHPPQNELALPSKSKNPASVANAWDGLNIEFKDSVKSKTATAVPIASFAAVLIGLTAEDAALELMRDLINGSFAHPRRKELIKASLEIAGASKNLAEWRAELVKQMNSSLSDYQAERGDPRLLEKRLQSGLDAMEIFRLTTLDEKQEEELQEKLVSEYSELKRSMAVAAALRKAGFYDAYLSKLNKIGLARWTRPEVAQGEAPALKESAAEHHGKALELEKAGLLGKASDEAKIANDRVPCDHIMADHFYSVRVEYVNRNMVPMAAQTERSRRNMLEQIVRELEGIGDDRNIDQVRMDYFRKRIEEGLRIDKTYLPLQLKRAEFLSRTGNLTESQNVVLQMEREQQLTKQEADSWLRMDASLAERQTTTRMRAEKEAKEFFESGKFAEALTAAENGLRADPGDSKLLFYAARASAVLRNDKKSHDFALEYLRSANPACTAPDEGMETMIGLLDRKAATPSESAGENYFPHWISGKRYRIGDLAYDPVSGGFFQQVRTISAIKGNLVIAFRWDGFTVSSITAAKSTVQGKNTGDLILFELEPKYRREFVYMSEIGMKANSSGDRAAYPLLYLNSPDFDPRLAEQYSKKTFTRGWAGNPFFHPFLWTGIFLFDISYDLQGRITEARPVYPDTSRPRSTFSEVLTFKWDGNSNRLLSITGQKYSRTMKYDSRGRLTEERIEFDKGRGKGWITYKYEGKSYRIKQAKSEDNFFDKATKSILFREFTE